ncbi:unnamed protein product [Urochloa humidicola]
MATNSNSQSDHPEESSENATPALTIPPIEAIWDFINDPVEDQIVAQIKSQIEEEQMGGTSNQHRRFSRRYVVRDREAGQKRLIGDYFCDNPVYNDVQFRRRYRMRRPLFLQIVQTLSDWSPYFQQRSDAAGKLGFSALHKCTVAMRMLAYGTCADMWDENFRIAESTIIESLTKFCEGVIVNFGETYLRRPNKDDIQRLLHVGVARGFPGMLGSLDCMHWQWKNCPVAWKGQYTRGDYKVSTVMLEAVASYDLWIWHAFFGTPGSNNDINVLNNSNLFTEVLQGRAPEVQFMVNGNEYNMGYYLTDGIYPEWATFVKSVPRPLSAKDKLFAQKQEGARKDVECAFGVLQARFAILRNPARMWQCETLSQIMYACIILHNMIVEDERDSYGARKDFDYDQENTAPMVQYQQGAINEFARMLEINTAIHDRSTHRRLKADLTEHIWQRYGNNYMEQDSGSNED